MENSKLINVVLATDENLYLQTGVVILSAVRNCSDPQRLNFHILTTKSMPIVERFFDSLTARISNKISIHKIKSNLFLNINIPNYPTEALLRLLAPERILSKKIIYLDSDTLIIGDLIELSQIDLKNKTAAAAIDGLPDIFGKTHKYRKSIGIKNPDYYFNSGLMIIDTELWIKKNIAFKCLEWLKNHPNIGLFADQDPLNLYLEDDILYIDPKWNLQTTLINSILYKGRLAENYIHSYKDAKILHFVGEKKPWKLKFYLPFKYTYFQYYKEICRMNGSAIRFVSIFDIHYLLGFFNHIVKILRARIRSKFRNEIVIHNPFIDMK